MSIKVGKHEVLTKDGKEVRKMNKETYEALKRIVGSWDDGGKKLSNPETGEDRRRVWDWIDEVAKEYTE